MDGTLRRIPPPLLLLRSVALVAATAVVAASLASCSGDVPLTVGPVRRAA